MYTIQKHSQNKLYHLKVQWHTEKLQRKAKKNIIKFRKDTFVRTKGVTIFLDGG